MKNNFFTKFVVFSVVVALIAALGVSVISADDSQVSTDTPQVVFESKSVVPQTLVTVSVSFKEMPEIKSILIEDFVYDADVLELVGGTWVISDPVIADWDASNQVATAAFEGNTDCNGIILKLSFKVKPDAEGSSSISANTVLINKSATSGDVVAEDEAVSCEVKAGEITVVDCKQGDVNGDGVVNSDDAIYLLRHTLAPDTYPANQDGDMNGDGSIDSNDAIHLLRYTLSPDSYPLNTYDPSNPPVDDGEGDEDQASRVVERIEISGTNLIIYYTDGTTETVDLSGLAGDPNEKEVLVYSLLSDGTYGVMAGGMAKYEAVIEIPETYNGVAVTQIMPNAFKNLTILQKVIIPEGVTSIGDNAFYGCIGLSTIELPDALTSIGRYAFYNCSSITDIIIPDSTRFIGAYAFYNSGILTATISGKWLSGCTDFTYKYYVRSYNTGSTDLNDSTYISIRTFDISDPSNAALALSGAVNVRYMQETHRNGYKGTTTTTYYEEPYYWFAQDWTSLA